MLFFIAFVLYCFVSLQTIFCMDQDPRYFMSNLSDRNAIGNDTTALNNRGDRNGFIVTQREIDDIIRNIRDNNLLSEKK